MILEVKYVSFNKDVIIIIVKILVFHYLILCLKKKNNRFYNFIQTIRYEEDVDYNQD